MPTDRRRRTVPGKPRDECILTEGFGKSGSQVSVDVFNRFDASVPGFELPLFVTEGGRRGTPIGRPLIVSGLAEDWRSPCPRLSTESISGQWAEEPHRRGRRSSFRLRDGQCR